jgi:hypothetical protein
LDLKQRCFRGRLERAQEAIVVANDEVGTAGVRDEPGSAEPPRTISHAHARAVLARTGTASARIDEILADYPDPIDLTAAEPALFAKFGISKDALMDRMGGSP